MRAAADAIRYRRLPRLRCYAMLMPRCQRLCAIDAFDAHADAATPLIILRYLPHFYFRC